MAKADTCGARGYPVALERQNSNVKIELVSTVIPGTQFERALSKMVAFSQCGARRICLGFKYARLKEEVMRRWRTDLGELGARTFGIAACQFEAYLKPPAFIQRSGFATNELDVLSCERQIAVGYRNDRAKLAHANLALGSTLDERSQSAFGFSEIVVALHEQVGMPAVGPAVIARQQQKPGNGGFRLGKLALAK